MNKNFVVGSLTLLLLVNGWAFLYFQLPFYKVGIMIAAVSLLLMTLLHERFVFLYAMVLVISYAVFLTVYSFIYHQPTNVQLLYVYDHLLLTSFILIYWILLSYTKRMGYENEALKQQVKLLQKYISPTGILTVHEFMEQAKWVLTSARRNKQSVWLVELTITYKNSYTEQNLLEKIGEIGFQSIRRQFDLLTYHDNGIYLILRDTERDGVDIVLNRIEEKAKEVLNLLHPPYEVKLELIHDIDQLKKIGEWPK